MTFERRLAAAHRELADKGAQALNYNPPIIWLLRKAGFTLRGLTTSAFWSTSSLRVYL